MNDTNCEMFIKHRLYKGNMSKTDEIMVFKTYHNVNMLLIFTGSTDQYPHSTMKTKFLFLKTKVLSLCLICKSLTISVSSIGLQDISLVSLLAN